MIHELFEKQTQKWQPFPQVPGPATPASDECVAFGWVRGERDRAAMLELRHANGNITAYSYGLLDSAIFDPSAGITLSFSGVTVKLVGINLNMGGRQNVRLFEGITRHQVLWVREANEPCIREALESDVVIESVVISAT